MTWINVHRFQISSFSCHLHILIHGHSARKRQRTSRYYGWQCLWHNKAHTQDCCCVIGGLMKWKYFVELKTAIVETEFAAGSVVVEAELLQEAKQRKRVCVCVCVRTRVWITRLMVLIKPLGDSGWAPATLNRCSSPKAQSLPPCLNHFTRLHPNPSVTCPATLLSTGKQTDRWTCTHGRNPETSAPRTCCLVWPHICARAAEGAVVLTVWGTRGTVLSCSVHRVRLQKVYNWVAYFRLVCY